MAISTTIQINGAAVRTLASVPWSSGMNVQSVLEQAYGQAGYSYQLQYFGVYGYELVAVDGVAGQQGSDASLYWAFLVNGQMAQQGIDATYPNDGDAIVFDYVVYNPAAHAGTRLEAVHKALGVHAKR